MQKLTEMLEEVDYERFKGIFDGLDDRDKHVERVYKKVSNKFSRRERKEFAQLKKTYIP